jgi:hypothetical protein
MVSTTVSDEFLHFGDYDCFPTRTKPSNVLPNFYRNHNATLHTVDTTGRQLSSLTTQAEWVPKYSVVMSCIDECAADPVLNERHKQGWRYNVVPDSVAIRRGPSFAAEKIGVDLLGGESVLINGERVSPAGENMSWLRVKDGRAGSTTQEMIVLRSWAASLGIEAKVRSSAVRRRLLRAG